MNVSCQCGAIRFKTPLPKPLAVYICHCDECRRQTTSAFGCSAIFPKFPLPSKNLLSLYSRPTASGHSLNCYFCKSCGTRLIHSTPGKDVVSVKGGCIEGLDWKSARHIWCSRAMVPIPEGVERYDEEPSDDVPQSDAPLGTGKDDNLMRGSGGSPGEGEKKVDKGKGKEIETASTDRRPSTRGRYNGSTTQSLNSREAETAAFLASRRMESLTGVRPSTELDVASQHIRARDSDLTSVRERESGRRRGNDKQLEKERVARWEKEVISQLDKIELEKKIETQQKELEELRALQAQKKFTDKPSESAIGSSDAENSRRRQYSLASSSRRPG